GFEIETSSWIVNRRGRRDQGGRTEQCLASLNSHVSLTASVAALPSSLTIRSVLCVLCGKDPPSFSAEALRSRRGDRSTFQFSVDETRARFLKHLVEFRCGHFST